MSVEEEEEAGGEADGGRRQRDGDGKRRRRNNLGSHENPGEEMKKYIGMSLDAFVDVLEMFANRSAVPSAAGRLAKAVTTFVPDRHGRVALESNSVRETMVIGAGGGRGNNNQRGLRPLRQTTYADVATEANVFGEERGRITTRTRTTATSF